MKMSGIKQMILQEIPQKTKIGMRKKCLYVVFLFFLAFISSLGITQRTLGIFSQSFVVNDSASAALFDIVITAPKEFLSEQGESDFEYHFLSDIDIQGFAFQVTNKGETAILCVPYINGDIVYRIYVGEEGCTEFCVEANESVSFWLVIAPDGLDSNIISNAKFFVDIQQNEGR